MTQAARPLTVALGEYDIGWHDPERSLERARALVGDAAAAGARLVVLPEMATTGYCWHDRAEIRAHVEPIPGPTTAAFADLARRFGCYIVVGMPELAPRTGAATP